MKYTVTINGKRYDVEVERVSPFRQLTREEIATGVVASPAPAAAAAGETAVPSPMPGTVLDVKAPVGTHVNAGDCVIMLEAMKMEVEVVAPQAGTVKAINVKKGDTVSTDQVLALLG